MESKNEVSIKFNKAARDYDKQRRKLIPCFDDFYNIAVSLLQSDAQHPRILDLGAGTGLLSSMLHQKYPEAHFTLIDLSEKMLEMAKKRFDGYNNVSYILGDYTNYVEYDSQNKYDFIVSALSIHHLNDEDKVELYQNVYENLKDGGIFVNADQVLGSTLFLESLYTSDWRQKVEASDLSRDEIDAAYERTKLDQMGSLESQIKAMQQIGYLDVDCVYKNYNFVVLHGRKAKSHSLKTL
ncbi:ubiquinone/menaquinone biosynthesis methyltransferase [compost metagenome]